MRVAFHPLGLAADVRPDETILDAARRAGAPVGNSCGAVGVCARCRVVVLEGAAALSARTAIEQIVAARVGMTESERLACQAVVHDDCRVTTTYWGA